SVKYKETEICALKGSTVFINGTYTKPAKFNVKEEFWVTENFNGHEDKPVYCRPTNASGRVQCYVDKQQHFSLKLINVTKEDEHDYRFRIKTNVANEKWLGDPVKTSVTELLVNTLLEVIEREAAVLTCATSCSLTDSPTFIWYKNGRPLSSNTNPLHLRPVSSEDAGSYMCAVRGYEHLPSPAQTLTVRYPPKNVSVSISPSGEIVENSSVTLSCSSDANPPVQNYTWFKEGVTSPVGSGETYNITISSNNSGEYTCQSSNDHRHGSHSVTLNVLYPPQNVSVSISPSGEIVEGSSVTLTCSSDANPPVQNYNWFKEKTLLGKESTHIIPNISSEDSGEYKCKSSNEHGSKYSSLILNVMYPPKNVSVSISPSGEIVEGSSVTLTCSSDANPPVQNYNWFKEKTLLGKESTHIIPNISSEDSGEYKCKSSNEHGSKYSSLILNVMYPPKNVSVSISPSGEIVEGSSVTLTCSSDANPPVQNYTWFKEKKLLGKESTHIIPNISSEDSGEYKCKSSNEHGSKYSSVILNVMYPPKNVSVSITPSGEILEGSSVTLTCSSDANPPVQNYNWFKEKILLGKESTHIIPNISFQDSGEYKCKSSNEHGSKYSSVILNVMYPPKNVSVSISPSGEIVEDSSVTLTCSSDANPPVQNYNWFKEGGTSPVGSGQTYNITISSNSSGWYYRVAQNEHGMLKSASIDVTLKGHFYILPVTVGVGLCGIVIHGESYYAEVQSEGPPMVQREHRVCLVPGNSCKCDTAPVLCGVPLPVQQMEKHPNVPVVKWVICAYGVTLLLELHPPFCCSWESHTVTTPSVSFHLTT
ncbi:B-cell receptor CD22-like, partial [Electrophorus electricus]|uniref:B-cell receptor CD22-like n=1 Tax=Electrophorus electricus TaxID=8005 RepID=UPI0015D0B89F